MKIRQVSFSLLLLIQLYAAVLISALNYSNIIYSLPVEDDLDPDSHLFLKDVLKAIVARQKWDAEKTRVLKLEKARFGYSRRHDFVVRIGKKKDLTMGFSEDVGMWMKIGESGGFEGLVDEVSSQAVLQPFEVEGPFELLAHGDDELALELPTNTSRSGLKRILVGEGIKLQITGAKEVSFFLASCNGFQYNVSSPDNIKKSGSWPLQQQSCPPLLPIHLSGSASLIASGSNNPSSSLQMNTLSNETVELVPEKCYEKYVSRKLSCPFNLDSRVAAMQRVVRTLLGDEVRQYQYPSPGSHKAKTKASTLVRFQLELETDIKKKGPPKNDWRTKPSTKRARFDIVARVDEGKLNPVRIKQVREFTSADSASWSSTMPNVSYTRFRSVLVSPQTLTLDIK